MFFCALRVSGRFPVSSYPHCGSDLRLSCGSFCGRWPTSGFFLHIWYLVKYPLEATAKTTEVGRPSLKNHFGQFCDLAVNRIFWDVITLVSLSLESTPIKNFARESQNWAGWQNNIPKTVSASSKNQKILNTICQNEHYPLQSSKFTARAHANTSKRRSTDPN